MQPGPGFGAPPASTAPVGPASRARRLGAWGVDAALLLTVAVLLGMMTWGRLNNIVDGVWGQVLGATGGLLLSGGDVRRAAADFGMSIWRDVVTAITQALLLLVLIELLYRFAAERFAGRTLGKLVVDLRVASTGTARRRVFLRALVTTAGGTGLYAAAWILLLHGQFLFALLTWLAAVAVLLANGLPALAGARRRTLADRAGRTIVVPVGAYRRAAETAAQGAGAAWTGAQQAGRAVRDNAARIAQDDRMRRALESERARQIQDLGRQSAAKVRDAMDGDQVRRAREAGRRLGDRLRGARSGTAPNERPAPQPGAPAPPVPPALPPPEPRYGPYPQQQAQPWRPPPAPPGRDHR